MARHIAVLFVHGIFNFDDKYHLPMQQRILAALPKHLRSHVDFEAAYWAPVVRERQADYLGKLTSQSLVSNNDYRRLVLQGLGDAAAYQKTKAHANSSYYQIQGAVRAAIDRLDNRVPSNCPLVFIGHSLGCHILSSFAWDTNTVKQFGDDRLRGDDDKVREFAAYLKDGSPFRRLDTLAGFITMGCNIPLFTFTFGPDSIIPITRSRRNGDHPAFPGVSLPPDLAKHARWENYYSRNDVLGYPLKPLNKAYAEETRLTDLHVKSEGQWRSLLSNFFPIVSVEAAHVGYWTRSKVVQGAAKLITDLMLEGEGEKPPRFLFGSRDLKPS